MANVDFTGKTSTFNMNDLDLTDVAEPAIANTTLWGNWNAQDVGFTATTWLFGDGLTYSGDDLTGGNVTSAAVNTDSNPGASLVGADLAITELQLDGSIFNSILSLTPDGQSNLYWRHVLSSDDEINLGDSAFSITFAGDGRNVETGQFLVGGTDMIYGAAGGTISGDYFDIAAGAVVFGGDDTIIRTGSGSIYGDADDVFGTLVGGNDYIFSTGSSNLFGDANDLLGLGAVVVGGDDVIIRGGSSGGTIWGDADNVDNGEAVYGGNDTLVGGAGNDRISGDVDDINAGATFSGGNDTLIGGAGHDSLYGDWESNDIGLAAFGGADVLLGGAGNDNLYGNGGNDYLDGGQGFDLFDGGTGTDTASYESSTAGVFAELYLNQAQNDGYGTTDFFIGIENVTGSYFNDVIVGDINDNVIVGLAGNDTIYGLGGNDYILGNQGSDYMLGGEGYDTFAFNSTDFAASTYDVIADFSESGTSFDYLTIAGLSAANTTMVEYSGNVLIYSNAIGATGGIVIEDFTIAQLGDQLLFV